VLFFLHRCPCALLCKATYQQTWLDHATELQL
jgi:hypothetical protein